MANNDLDRIYAEIIKGTRQSIERIFNEAKQVAYREITDKWYSYKPTMYNRLNLMLDSLLIDVQVVGNTVIGKLYIRDDYMHPASNSFNKNSISFEELYEWFADGRHPSGQSEDILEFTNEDMFESGKVIRLLQSYMKDKGFNIK